MKFKLFLLALTFLPAIMQAQKPLPIHVISYLNQVPSLESSSNSFKMCTIETDKNGVVSVKDVGSVFKNLEDELNKFSTDGMNSGMSDSYSNASVPSQDKINQMMQNADQMKNMSPDQLRQMSQSRPHQAAPSANSISLMKEVGTGQKAGSQISQLSNQLNLDALKIITEFNEKMKAIGEFKNTCSTYKVPGADIALPKCDCIKDVYLNYYQKRVNVEDQYLEKLNELIQSYIPKLKDQMAIVDKVESDCQYGDAINVSAVKIQLTGIQRQAMSAIMPLLGMVEQRTLESAKEYANIVNTQNGHAPTPCK